VVVVESFKGEHISRWDPSTWLLGPFVLKTSLTEPADTYFNSSRLLVTLLILPTQLN